MSKSTYFPVSFKVGNGEGDTLTVETLEDVSEGVSVTFVLNAGTTQDQARQLIDSLNKYVRGTSVIIG